MTVSFLSDRAPALTCLGLVALLGTVVAACGTETRVGLDAGSGTDAPPAADLSPRPDSTADSGADDRGGTGDTGTDSAPDLPPPPDECARLSTELQAALDRAINGQNLPGGAAEVILPGCTWTGVTGVSDRSTSTPLSIGDQFFAGSITKTFTAITVLSLVGDGLLSLDDLVTTYVPEFTDASQVTVRQLLNHTSGLFDYQTSPEFGTALQADFDRAWTPAELLAFAAGKPATVKQGTFSYSGTNSVLAGLVIEDVTGSTVAEQFRTRIIEPLQLEGTYLAGFEPAAAGTLSHGYLPNGTDVTSFFGRQGVLTASWTTGSLVSTLADVRRLFQALLVDETLLGAAELAEMKTFVATDAGFQLLSVPGYGLGLVQRTTTLGTGTGNGGSSAGWGSRSFYFAEADALVSLFVNNGLGVDPTFDVLIELLVAP